MPYSCAAYGCSNTTENCKEKNISFHGFPLNNIKILNEWLLNLRRKEFIPNRHSKLCSEHFDEKYFTHQVITNKRFIKADAIPTKFTFDKKYITGRKLTTYQFDDPVKPSQEYLKIKLIDLRADANAVPVLLNTYSKSKRKTTDITKRFKSNESIPGSAIHDIESDCNILSAPISEYESSDEVSISDDPGIRTVETHVNAVPVPLSNSSDLQFQLRFLKKKPDSASFKVETISDDHTMYAVTGFSVKVFHAIFKFLRLDDLLTKDCQIAPLDQFFLMTLYLKTGINQHCLAFLYKVKQSTVSRMIINTAIVIYNKLKKFDIWPSREVVQEKTLSSFSKKFPNCRIIIDCVEFPIQNPFSTITQKETLNRKNIYTMKGLVGITPSGTVSFISDLVGGSIPDKNLFLSSGLLDLLQPGDLVLSDKGFSVKQELEARGCELATPSFCNFKMQCSTNEIDEDAAMSHYRGLIEKVISRIRTYKYFDGQIANRGLHYSNKYFFIVAFFLNFANPLVPDEND